MIETEVIQYMQASVSIPDWHKRKKYIVQNTPDYLDFWYQLVVMSGVMWITLTTCKDRKC